MVSMNHLAREINCKIVYCGAGLSGKTTNVQHIYAKTSPLSKGKLVSLATKQERTLFFDFLPLSIGEIRGFKVRLHLYSVPGQIFYDTSRHIILHEADGVVFVVDSAEHRMESNLVSWDNLQGHMQSLGLTDRQVPIVLQYNKRDAENAVPLDELQALFNHTNLPYFEAIASRGIGVFETLKAISKQVLSKSASQEGTARPYT